MPEGAGGGKEDSSSSPKDGNGGAFSWSVLSVGTSISSAVEAGRFMPKGAGGGKEGSPSSPKDGIGGISSRSMLSISCSDESKGAGENWGRGGNSPSLSSEVCDSSDSGVRGILKGAGGGSEGSPSSPKDGNEGASSCSVLSLSSSVELKGAGENWGRGGNRSSLFSEVCDS